MDSLTRERYGDVLPTWERHRRPSPMPMPQPRRPTAEDSIEERRRILCEALAA